MNKIIIIDGYIDEPSTFGVPPYISPYPRYIAGAIFSTSNDVLYATIDQWRKGSINFADYNILILIAGAIVPGKYLRTSPASLNEIKKIGSEFKGIKILAGPISSFEYNIDFVNNINYDFYTKGDPDAWIYDFLMNITPKKRNRTDDEWKIFSIAGAKIITEHPDFPVPLIAEIDLYRGCIRYKTGGCLFCTEILYGKIRNRHVEDVIKEIATLYSYGVRYFRLGGATCVLTYGAIMVDEKLGDFKPDPDIIEKLLKGIWKVAPDIKVLHTDNANPHVIYEYPEESEKIIKMLVKYTTPGNVLSFGLESADPVVIKKNNLNSNSEELLFAIDMVNKYGRTMGINGMPALLPGINFISGLEGESEDTYECNKKFLIKIMESGNIVRRVNIRQVAPVRYRFKTRIKKDLFLKFKEFVRGTFDRAMLNKMLPQYTILRDIFIELNIMNEAYGRQIGTYPLIVKFPYRINVNKFIDAKVISYGGRSVKAIDTEFNINYAPLSVLKKLPRISEKDAVNIVMNRPFDDYEALSKVINHKELLPLLTELVKINKERYWLDEILNENMQIKK